MIQIVWNNAQLILGTLGAYTPEEKIICGGYKLTSGV